MVRLQLIEDGYMIKQKEPFVHGFHGLRGLSRIFKWFFRVHPCPSVPKAYSVIHVPLLSIGNNHDLLWSYRGYGVNVIVLVSDCPLKPFCK